MILLKSLAAGFAAIFLIAGNASAQNLVTLGTVGVWDILVDPSVGNGCLINAMFEDGSDVRIGFDADAAGGYVLAANDAWGDIVEGDVYPITFDLDGEVYHGEAVGLYLDDLPGVDIEFDSAEFLMDIALKQTMTLIYDDYVVMSIDLTDSAVALEAAIECQEMQG